MLASVRVLRGQHDRRGRIGEGSDPRAMQNEEDEEEDRDADDDESAVHSINVRRLVLLKDGSKDLEPCGDILDGILLGSLGGRRLVLLGLLRVSNGDGILLFRGSIGATRRPRVNIDVQNCRKSHGGSDTNTWSESQHQSNHDAGKVGSNESVDDDEHMLVPEFPEAKDHAGGKEENEKLEIHEEGRPGSRLVLRN